jgi:hypothetical protein
VTLDRPDESAGWVLVVGRPAAGQRLQRLLGVVARAGAPGGVEQGTGEPGSMSDP